MKIDILGQSIPLVAGYTIPIHPDRLADIEFIVGTGEPDITQLYQVVSRDVGLSAVVLKIMNSPVFGFHRKITDIKQSIMLLGVDFFHQILNCDFIIQAVPESSSITMERFWDSSQQLSLLTSFLIEHLEIKSDTPFEDAYTAGLFLDCGIPVMAAKYDNYIATLGKANQTFTRMFTEVEDASHNTNHSVIGYFVAKSWNLPDIICETIRNLHFDGLLDSNEYSIRHKDLHALLKLAEGLLHKYKYGQKMSECQRIREDIMGYFNLSDLDFYDLEQDALEYYSNHFDLIT